MKKNKFDKMILKNIPTSNKIIQIKYKPNVKRAQTEWARTYPHTGKIFVTNPKGINTLVLIHEILHNSIYDVIYKKDKQIKKEWKEICKKDNLMGIDSTPYERFIHFAAIYTVCRDMRLLDMLYKKYPNAVRFFRKLSQKLTKYSIT